MYLVLCKTLAVCRFAGWGSNLLLSRSYNVIQPSMASHTVLYRLSQRYHPHHIRHPIRRATDLLPTQTGITRKWQRAKPTALGAPLMLWTHDRRLRGSGRPWQESWMGAARLRRLTNTSSFNMCLSQAVVSQCFKATTIIPVWKRPTTSVSYTNIQTYWL